MQLTVSNRAGRTANERLYLKCSKEISKNHPSGLKGDNTRSVCRKKFREFPVVEKITKQGV